jgi:NAD(P)-dependent dehydrogenase (short-subunit alcohol dehydrogenase family)
VSRFEGKVALVTGGARGIGLAIARRLAAEGASVGVLALHAETARRAAAGIGDRALPLAGDVRDEEAVARAVDDTVTAFGRLDVMVNNAGTIVIAPVLETSVEEWDRVLEVNLRGAFLGSREAARQMVAQGDGGRIVFSSSVTGSRAIPNLSAYAVTKAGLQHMATALALELGPHAITVNALAIGATVNERNLSDDPDYAERWAKILPTGRVGHPEDVAGALSYLVSPAAAMVTGHTLTVDGGWTGMGRTP